jgi:hypothetical protein
MDGIQSSVQVGDHVYFSFQGYQQPGEDPWQKNIANRLTISKNDGFCNGMGRKIGVLFGFSLPVAKIWKLWYTKV